MVKIQRKSNGQTVVTIPTEIANAMNIDDKDDAEWSIASATALRLQLDK